MLLIFAGAALPILPFALWLAEVDAGLVGSRLAPGRELSLAQTLEGATALLGGIPLVFLSWIAFVLFFAWRCPKTPPASPALPQRAAISLASLTAIMTVALMAAVFMTSMASGASPFGITRFAIHYLFPFCVEAACRRVAAKGML